MGLTMYRNIHDGRICIAKYIMKMSSNALSEIVNTDNIFTSVVNDGALGFYYAPQSSVLVHDDVWIVKYGYNDYMMYSQNDFLDKFILIEPNLDNIQEYIRSSMKRATNRFVYEEIIEDVLKLV